MPTRYNLTAIPSPAPHVPLGGRYSTLAGLINRKLQRWHQSCCEGVDRWQRRRRMYEWSRVSIMARRMCKPHLVLPKTCCCCLLVLPLLAQHFKEHFEFLTVPGILLPQAFSTCRTARPSSAAALPTYKDFLVLALHLLFPVDLQVLPRPPTLCTTTNSTQYFMEFVPQYPSHSRRQADRLPDHFCMQPHHVPHPTTTDNPPDSKRPLLSFS